MNQGRLYPLLVAEIIIRDFTVNACVLHREGGLERCSVLTATHWREVLPAGNRESTDTHQDLGVSLEIGSRLNEAPQSLIRNDRQTPRGLALACFGHDGNGGIILNMFLVLARLSAASASTCGRSWNVGLQYNETAGEPIMTTKRTCMECGAELPQDAPQGHCSRCRVRLEEGPTMTPRRGITVDVENQVGRQIGRYKLLQKIGEGGCGVVYMAEQEEPVRRRVALKVIKLGMDTKSVIARFEAERQALAMMDHPNIAKVLDGGATETGRPYFVMELVRGTKITEFCDQNRLPTRERLDLFIQVCQAVQHAHQKGIIHRDLKPSNILVTLHDPGAPGAHDH